MDAYRPDKHKWRLLRATVLVYLFLCFLFAMPVEALRSRTNWAERVNLSEKIVRGEVISVKSYWNSERTRIYTTATILVDEHIKGNGSREVTITVPGGTVGEDTHWVSDTPHFDVGDYAIVLIERSGHVTGGPDGVRLIQRPVSGANRFQSLSEDRFLSWTKAYVNGRTRISFEESPEENPAVPLEQNISSSAAISGVNPPTISAGTDSILTVSGNGFGSSRGTDDYPTIAFRYRGNNYMFDNSKIISWSDTQIQAEVFTGSIGGNSYSPGSWNDTVAFINGSGDMESSYSLSVPFGYGQAKWSSPSVPYYINTTGAPSGSEVALRAAANTWNGAGANFSFDYGGSTSRGRGQDGQNVLSFTDLGSDTIIAQTTTYSNRGIITESDIQFNTGFVWSTDTPTPNDKMDLQSIAVHELGHWLRLLDLYGANDAARVMYGFSSNGKMKRNLTSGDQAGIQWIYPAGSNCSYSIFPTNQSFTASGGTDTVNVTTNSNCSWTATSNVSWLTITSGSSGSGSGTVYYSVPSSTDISSRSGTMTIAGQTFNVSQSGTVTSRFLFDFDGDGRTDIAVWTPSDGYWNIINSSDASFTYTQYGAPTDILVAGDYDGDGKTDIAVWRPEIGLWFIINSSDGSYSFALLGAPDDIPVPRDYDGDGKTDVAVWRPSNGLWTIVRSSDGSTAYTTYGAPNDIPIPGDYDGDGKTDIAVWRPGIGLWFIINSSNGSYSFALLGGPSDILVPGDYDGDGKTDAAAWTPSNGLWSIIRSSDKATTYTTYGAPTDIPVPGDYDEDGKTDIAIWRPSNGFWYIKNSSDGSNTFIQLGGPSDIPISQ